MVFDTQEYMKNWPVSKPMQMLDRVKKYRLGNLEEANPLFVNNFEVYRDEIYFRSSQILKKYIKNLKATIHVNFYKGLCIFETAMVCEATIVLRVGRA